MRGTLMKKYILVGLATIMITLIFGGGVCVALHSGCNLFLYSAILAVAWLVAVGLLFSIVFGRKRQGRVLINKHSK